MSNEEETYSTIFTALRHPIRRRILRMLSSEAMTFTNMLNSLGIESSHLTYHLESLGVLTAKTEEGMYELSTFGAAAVSMMGEVEDVPQPELKPGNQTVKWKAVLVIMVVGVAVLSGAYYYQHQALRGLHADYVHLSEDFTQLQADNDAKLEAYSNVLAEYNMMVDYAIESIPSDYVVYVSIASSSFSWLAENESFCNLLEEELALIPKFRDAIKRLEARLNEADAEEQWAGTGITVNVTEGKLLIEILEAEVTIPIYEKHPNFWSNLKFGAWYYRIRMVFAESEGHDFFYWLVPPPATIRDLSSIH